jgi:hypothetical protein
MTTTVSTPFLRSLQPADMRTRHARVASRYLAIKGFTDVRPLGVIPLGDNSWYYYYDLPDGILELEVTENPGTHEFTRTVTALITDPEQIREYLGR